MGKYKKVILNNRSKISAPTWSKYSLFWTCFKRHEDKADNLSIRIYVNKIENRIKFQIKKRYYLELVIPEKMKLLGRTKTRITKNQNGGNVLQFDIIGEVLVNSNIANNDYQQSCLHFLLINHSIIQLLHNSIITYFKNFQIFEIFHILMHGFLIQILNH